MLVRYPTKLESLAKQLNVHTNVVVDAAARITAGCVVDPGSPQDIAERAVNILEFLVTELSVEVKDPQ
jgi:hypothetical protein